jgi:xanthine dehydrogenase YagR molybdenum-binding subunit
MAAALDNRPLNKGASLDDNAARMDGVAKVTGAAKYGRDQYFGNGVFIGFIRCPYGAGTLESHDRDAALALPGVLEVEVTGERGQYHGHTVGHIVAESKLALQRALRSLNAQWRPGEVKTTIDDSDPQPDAPNSESEGIFAQADHVLEAVYSTAVQTHSPLETHGASIDWRGDRAVCHISTQGTFAARDNLDDAIGLPRSNYEVVCEYVGGGFGSKLNGAGKEGVLAARIASKYKRPAYCFVDRAEDHLDTGNRPSSKAYVKIGAMNDGTILGGVVHTFGGVGVAGQGGGCSIPSRRYNLGRVQKSHGDIQFNGGAPRAFRAPGSPQGAFAEELMLDEIAALIGMDPLTLRMKIDGSADRRGMYEKGAELIGWSQRQKNGAHAGVLRRGFGCGSASWGRFPSEAEAEVVINRDGSVEARSGTQDIGTGQRTVMGIMAATGLGVPLSAVNVSIGKSSLPPGPGSGGSVTAHNTAPAMERAALDAKQKFLTMLAEDSGGDASEFSIVDGEILRHNEPLMEWAEACRKIRGDNVIGRGRWSGQRDVQQDQTQGSSDGVQFVDLSVDTETGVIRVNRIVALQACGLVVCRKTAESQIIGGVIQGLSYGLFEDRLLDRNVGAMVNPNLEWYKIAGTADMPDIVPVLWTENQTGVRSLGEPPTIPTAGAIACAVFNAIGRPVRHAPLTPDKVLAAMEGGGA